MPGTDKLEDGGLSSSRLQRVRDALQADIDKDVVPSVTHCAARTDRNEPA